ncbi:1990_t:CDS:2 [Funneliformis mosseae]|uniref:1990_t:CDS:1 n=1 Tax=Funneliformis mosseae TaxID=27381 RepID=A0A9N9GE44_FUNMO|nr:1990_t:CDS:2 [Funneliformis mosseae]
MLWLIVKSTSSNTTMIFVIIHVIMMKSFKQITNTQLTEDVKLEMEIDKTKMGCTAY